MAARPKIIWPHPSPLHDWWTQVMESTAARLSAHHASSKNPPEAAENEHPAPQSEDPSSS